MTRKQTLVTYESIRMQKHLNYTCDKEYDGSQFLCIEYQSEFFKIIHMYFHSLEYS